MRPRGIFLFLFCALSDALLALAQPTITEYSLPTASSYPTAIIKGPDGNLWFTEVGKIGKITTDGAITEYAIPTANTGTPGITAGPDGNVWFIESPGNKIGKITPNGVITEYPLPTPNSYPSSITAGPDGNVWFTEQTAIGKITPTGALTEYPSGNLGGGQITAGPDGNLWFIGLMNGHIGRITPSGAMTDFPLSTAIPTNWTLAPQAILPGPDSNLWAVTNNMLWKITAPGSAVPYDTPAIGAIAAGPDGNFWGAVLFNQIYKLTTSGTYIKYAGPTASGMAAGSDGNLWFTESGGNKIGKLILSTVPPDNLLTLNQDLLTFTAPVYGNSPASQALTVSASTATPFTASMDPSQSCWMSISPSGNLNTSQNITVSVNQTCLGGTYGVSYFGFVLFTSGNVTQTVRVTLSTTPPTVGGDVKVAPRSLSFNCIIGTSPPTAQEISITDVNPLSGFIPLTISYEIRSAGNWLALTTAGGQPLPSGSKGTSGMGVLAHVDPTGLYSGVYNAVIVIAPTNGTTVIVPVTLTVTTNPNPAISATPSTLNFVWQQGAVWPAAQSVQVTASGSAVPFSVQSDYPAWVSITPIVAGTTPATLIVSAAPIGLAPGTYTGTITILSPPGAPAKIAVSLTVLPAQPLTQEYAVPTANSQPLCIATGPDGNIWFTESSANRIGKITPAGAVTEYSLPPNTVPSGITAGPDGNIWFTEMQTSKIGRITTTGAITEFALAPSSVPRQITEGPDNNLWFTEDAANKLGRITIGGAITEYVLPTSMAGLGSIVTGPDGALWFTERNLNRIGKITTSGSVVEYPVSGMAGPVAIAMGFDGNLWVTAPDAIWKITPAGAATPYFLPGANSVPQGIAAGPDGNVWFAEASGNRIGRLTPGGVLTEFQLPGAGSSPDYIAMGRDGNMWFTEPTGNRIGKVAMSLAPAPDLLYGLNSSPITFAGTAGGGPTAAQYLSVSAPNPKAFTASVRLSSAPWLSISPSGNLTTPQNITITVNTAALVPGTYVGNILLTSGNVTQTVVVTLTVTAASVGGSVVVSPSSFTFGPAFSTGGLVIANATPGTGPIPVTISSTISSPPGGKWLTLAATSGTIPAWTTGNAPSMNIQVSVDLTGLAPGSYVGSITVAPTGGAAVIVPVTLMVPTASTVVIKTVVNAASFATGAVAPGEIVTISGSGLGPVGPLGLALDPNGNVGTWLGGVSVSFNGYLSPLTYANATQINCVVPYEIDGATDVVVQVNYSGQSGTFALKTTAVMPAVFTLNGSGSGTAAAANSTGGYNGPGNPAPAGSAITLYLTGEGKTNPAGVTGKVTTVDTTSGGPLTPQPTAGAPSVAIGGQPATVLFYGEAPGMVSGVMQLNVQIPAGLPTANPPLVVSFGAASSQNGITVAIQ